MVEGVGAGGQGVRLMNVTRLWVVFDTQRMCLVSQHVWYAHILCEAHRAHWSACWAQFKRSLFDRFRPAGSYA